MESNDPVSSETQQRVVATEQQFQAPGDAGGFSPTNDPVPLTVEPGTAPSDGDALAAAAPLPLTFTAAQFPPGLAPPLPNNTPPGENYYPQQAPVAGGTAYPQQQPMEMYMNSNNLIRDGGFQHTQFQMGQHHAQPQYQQLGASQQQQQQYFAPQYAEVAAPPLQGGFTDVGSMAAPAQPSLPGIPFSADHVAQCVSTLAARLSWVGPRGSYQATGSPNIMRLQEMYHRGTAAKVALLAEMTSLRPVHHGFQDYLFRPSSLLAPEVEGPHGGRRGRGGGKEEDSSSGGESDSDDGGSSSSRSSMDYNHEKLKRMRGQHSIVPPPPPSNDADGISSLVRDEMIDLLVKAFFNLGGGETDYNTQVKNSDLVRHPLLIRAIPDRSVRERLLELSLDGKLAFLSTPRGAEGVVCLKANWNPAEHILRYPQFYKCCQPITLPNAKNTEEFGEAKDGWRRADLGNSLRCDLGVSKSATRTMYLTRLQQFGDKYAFHDHWVFHSNGRPPIQAPVTVSTYRSPLNAQPVQAGSRADPNRALPVREAFDKLHPTRTPPPHAVTRPSCQGKGNLAVQLIEEGKTGSKMIEAHRLLLTHLSPTQLIECFNKGQTGSALKQLVSSAEERTRILDEVANSKEFMIVRDSDTYLNNPTTGLGNGTVYFARRV